ncbi:MAG: histidine phosphatase family protein [Candidatus Kapabacteria bacterium]|nr:histidine phosphatase family protein [Ignavibacteriota bacterium]MCW5885765.1 histidine phosphatase family protein [Candidatus Kapabacteria bacterium]
MKTIIFVRHAKSSWDNQEWTDFDRPLNKRGFHDAPKMADIFSNKIGLKPVIYSSTAKRAITTAEYFADALQIDKNDINMEEAIYHQGMKFINKTIKHLDNNIIAAMFFGHNPDITSLATFFTGNYFENVPTCGIICIDFEVNSWEEVLNHNGNLRFFDYPKKYFTS